MRARPLIAEDTKARFRELWGEKLSTRAIGQRMGITKNAVVGMAYRMNLPARPSPIRRRPPVTSPKSVYSRTRGEWLRSSGEQWTDEPTEAGVWNEAQAEQLAVTTSPIHEPVVVDVPEGRVLQAERVRSRVRVNSDDNPRGYAAIKHTLRVERAPPPAPPVMWRNPGGCQFHLGGEGRQHLFCGEAVERGSWCPTHRAIVYVKRGEPAGLADAA